MSRIPYLAEADMTEHQLRRSRELTAARGGPVSGPGAFWLYNPSISECAEPLRQHMERGTSLPLAVSELAILIAARHWSATYAWCRHEPQVIKAGIEATAVAALRDGGTPQFADERAATTYAMARTLLETGGLDDSTYGRALKVFGLTALIELVAEVGYGSFVSLANMTFEPDPPGGAQDYLPAGVRPVAPTSAARDIKAIGTTNMSSDRLVGPAAQTWRHTPAIEECTGRYDEILREHLTLAPAASALIVLYVVRYWSASRLWPDSYQLALARGLNESVIDAVMRRIRPLSLSEEQALVYDFCDELLTVGRPSDETFERVRARLGFAGMIEIPAIIGFMSMAALTANVFGEARSAAI
jgi:4-carboxymuconolactone decarboxylase